MHQQRHYIDYSGVFVVENQKINKEKSWKTFINFPGMRKL